MFLGIQTIKDVFSLKYAALNTFKDDNTFIPSNSSLLIHYLTDEECAVLANDGLYYVPYTDGKIKANEFERNGWSRVFEGKCPSFKSFVSTDNYFYTV